MEAGTILVIVALIFVVLLVSEVPIAFVLALAGAIGILLTRGLEVTTAAVGNVPYTAVANYSLSIVPMYVLVGVFAVFARIAEHVYTVADRLLFRVRGGLGVATISACAGFAAVTGSSVATAATIGRLAIEEMRKRGYSDTLAAGLVAAAGTLGIMIPPSIILAIYGILTRESIASLLLAGVIPGIVSAVFYIVYIVLKGTGKGKRTTDLDVMKRSVRSLPWRGVVRVAIIFLLVMGGVYGGWFTVTESGALGAFFALIIMLVELRTEGIRRVFAVLKAAFLEVAAVTSMSFFIFIGSSIFTFYLVSAGIPTAFLRWVTGLQAEPVLVVALLLLVLIPMGMALDSLSILVIFVPLTYPVVSALGFDGIWFGILVVKGIELGQISPPVGINAYVVSGVSGIPPERVFRGVWPFASLDVALGVVLFLFPAIILWLPNLVGS
ncbi:MAG TPA: TRAP transporter large permease [Acidimicrobiia bacterium]|nr:TRAP transporter large permease [Acidimicrobiia bacterium]